MTDNQANAMLSCVRSQRDTALNSVVMLHGELAAKDEEIKGLQERLTAAEAKLAAQSEGTT